MIEARVNGVAPCQPRSIFRHALTTSQALLQGYDDEMSGSYLPDEADAKAINPWSY